MCSNDRYKAHNSSHESPCSPPHVEPKKQAHALRLQPPALAKLSAFGWSGSARFGARLRTKALLWGNRGIGALTWTYADLTVPITRHMYHQSPFRCTIHYPCSTSHLIRSRGLKLELSVAKSNCDCADCLSQSYLPLLWLLLTTGPCANRCHLLHWLCRSGFNLNRSLSYCFDWRTTNREQFELSKPILGCLWFLFFLHSSVLSKWEMHTYTKLIGCIGWVYVAEERARQIIKRSTNL